MIDSLFFYIGFISFLGLMGILLSIWEKKRNIKLAEKDIRELVRSLRAYFNKYKGFPITNYSQDEQDIGAVLNILVGMKCLPGIPCSQNVEILNPSLINFAEHFIGRTTINGCLVDPWGQPYKIAFDTNNDLVVEIDLEFEGSRTKKYIEAPFFIWSCGPDKKNALGNGDDITSWYISAIP